MSPFKIYPEPVRDYLVIKSMKAIDECLDLSIFSYEGLLFKEFKFVHPNNQHEYRADIKGLPRGNYYVMIHTDQGNMIERIQKS
jgi:hypothetical protein